MMMAPKSFHEARAMSARGSVVSCDSTARSTSAASAGAVGDQDRLRARIMLGLRQQIGGDPAGIAGVVGDHQHFRGAGDHVDADLAEHLPLGGGDIGIAGADDFRHRRDRRGAVGQRRHRLRAADAIDFGHAAKMGGRQHQRIELAVRRRHHHHHPRHAGDPGRHRIHQHRGRIGRGAAGHVEPDRIDRAPAPAEFDAERIGEALVLRQLPAVEHLDPVAGEFQRVERGGVASLDRGVDLGRGHAQAGGVDVEPVEFLGRLDQGGVAARGHVIDDGAGGALDIGRNLALGGEELLESLAEIGAACIQANGHGGFLGDSRRPLLNGAAAKGRQPLGASA